VSFAIGIAKVGIEEDRAMLRIRTHRLELARNRIERDLKRIAIQHSRQPGGAFKPNSELKADEARQNIPARSTRWAQIDVVRKTLLMIY
jgi:hypothetical protein